MHEGGEHAEPGLQPRACNLDAGKRFRERSLLERPPRGFGGLIRGLAAFVEAGLVSSNGEARRHVMGGGLRVNDVTVADEKRMLTPDHLTPEGVIKLSLGRKRHVLLKPV